MMDPTRAREINAALVAHAMYDMGLRDEDPPSLKGISLEEMIQATRILQKENRDNPNGGSCVCDDRLIAALYVLTHYPASDGDEAILVARNQRSGVAVVSLMETCSEEPL